MDPIVEKQLQKGWDASCRALFGREVGELQKFGPWLRGYLESYEENRSTFSGKKVVTSGKEYGEEARYASFEEVDFNAKFPPLSINEIKDIDSLVEMVRERLFYCGNIVLGNSKFVESSSNVVDSSYVSKSAIVNSSKYVFCSVKIRSDEYAFGVNTDAYSKFIVMCTASHKSTRMFEAHMGWDSSDCYYCSKLLNCSDCMFCFGTQNKRHAIGNLGLPKQKYLEIKKRLLEQIADELEGKKKVFSLFELVGECETQGALRAIKLPERGAPPTDKRKMEGAFSRTAEIVLGERLGNVDSYSGFLQRHITPNKRVLSPFGSEALIGGYLAGMLSRFDLSGRVVTQEEINELGKQRISEEEAQALAFDVKALAKNLHGIACITANASKGNNDNVIDSAGIIDAQDCYAGSAYVQSKKCGYCLWPRESEHLFGCSTVWGSSFCINAHQSKNVSRAFEVDNCESCSDVYFCHNCENVREGMFCFNTKNKSYAIGNVEIGKEDYARIKRLVLSEIVPRMKREKTIPWDVFGVGASRGNARS